VVNPEPDRAYPVANDVIAEHAPILGQFHRGREHVDFVTLAVVAMHNKKPA